MIVAFRTSTVAPSAISRLFFLSALFVPLFAKYNNLYLPCLVVFSTVTINSFAFGYLPYDMKSYAMISLLELLIFIGLHRRISITFNYFCFFALLYVFIINIVTSASPQDISYSIIAVGIGTTVFTTDRRNGLNSMLNAFTVISLVLSLIYLSNYEAFLDSYDAGIERSGWTDPNYLSCIVGMGIMTSLIQLLKKERHRFLNVFLYALTIILSLITQLFLASRGALLSVAVGMLILIILSEVKTSYKALIFILIGVLLLVLYFNNYFDLLMYRVIEDSGGGSGRTEIWQMKLSEFNSNASFLNLIFGMGHNSAIHLSPSGRAIGFHNDFIAVLCSYGIFGFLLFIYMLIFHPLLKTERSSRSVVLSLILYLVVACTTIEPLSSGRLVYWAFYALILLF